MSDVGGKISWLLCRRRAALAASPGSRVSIRAFADKSSTFGRYCSLAKGTGLYRAAIGDFTYVSENTEIKEAVVGRYCSIGPDVRVGGLGRHPTHWLSTHPAFYSLRGQTSRSYASQALYAENARTTVGNDVWIGMRVLIMDGVQIGDGAVIGAGSIVTRDVEPYAIVVGVPAKPIRKRFSDDVCQALLDLAWWNFPPDLLENLAPDFVSRDRWTAEDIAALADKARTLRTKSGL
jgi:Acetyltransferase (isoleucine patch superfamily)